MSVEAALCVHLNEYSMTDILNVYLRRGLSVFDGRNRAFMITSDGDEYDWEYLSVTFGELTGIISDKERGGSPVGIMLYENGEAVANLLKTSPGKLVITCDVNRRTLDGSCRRYTDVNWYIEKFIAALEADGFVFAGFDYWELR